MSGLFGRVGRLERRHGRPAHADFRLWTDEELLGFLAIEVGVPAEEVAALARQDLGEFRRQAMAELQCMLSEENDHEV
jgi:hypothetical protein